jgi:hypothetical protein
LVHIAGFTSYTAVCIRKEVARKVQLNDRCWRILLQKSVEAGHEP